MQSPDALRDLFRDHGRKITAQRLCIFRALEGDVTHPSAERVHEKVLREMPHVSLKTVYQTLNDLAELGAISVLDVGTGSARFDPNVETTHHHLAAARVARYGTWRPTSLVSRCHGGPPRGSPSTAPRSSSGDCATSAPARRFRSSNRPRTERYEPAMAALKGSSTEANLKEAFAGESQANRRYLYFAQKADVEGYPDVAALFRSVAEGETGHAFGHFDFLREVGDPVTGVPIGPTEDNLKSAIEGETYEYTEMYPGFAKTARDEGFEEIAEWLETLARAEKSHAGRFTKGLESLGE
jgi:rubrerythrin